MNKKCVFEILKMNESSRGDYIKFRIILPTIEDY